MAAINHAPTPKAFASKWTAGFGAAVRAAGGRDGRLSRNEAKKIGELQPSLAKYADNACNYLEHTGQKSVSIEKLIRAGYNYAYVVADKANVKGHTVSLVEARALPDDIRGDFYTLRGKADPTATDAKLVGAALADAFDKAATLPNGHVLEYMSEGDYPVLFAAAANHEDRAITGKRVLEWFQDVLEDGLYEDMDDVTRELAVEMSSAAESAAIVKDMLNPEIDPDADPYYAQMDQGFAKVAEVIQENLHDVRFVRVGPKDDDGSLAVDWGLYAHFLIGKTDDGQVAGVYYGSVET